MAIPSCAGEVCTQLAPHVDQICKDQGWPAGHKVLVGGPSGFCYCTCGAAAEKASAVKAEPGPPPVEPCKGTACYLDPRTVAACQGFPPGQTILMVHDGVKCTCQCWGGALVPFTVANGEGVQAPLDTIPVGGFVLAAGLDLAWTEMLVRWASRPYQSAPQLAYQVTAAGQTLQVPASHIFLTYQSKLILARQMIESIALMGSGGEPVAVETLAQVSTTSAFQFIATADETVGPDLRWHLLDSQGIVSADWAVQKAYQERKLPESLLAFPYGQ